MIGTIRQRRPHRFDYLLLGLLSALFFVTFVNTFIQHSGSSTFYHLVSNEETAIEISSLSHASKSVDSSENKADSGSYNENQEQGRFAYVFLIAGCDPKNPSYLGYIYNIIISKKMLQIRGSTQDVLILVRMHTSTADTTLPKEHESMLLKSGVIIRYLPKPVIDNFHTAMMDKFSILNLTDYDRVLFLDSDVMPIWNMDYLFHMSFGDNATLEENIILAYKEEPCNGGFFMLKPDNEDYKDLLELVEKTESSGYEFNTTIGWGHVITPPDAWIPYKGANGTKWIWHGAFSDQGLLYYWTKYHKKKVSIIIRDRVQRWRSNEKGEGEMASEERSVNLFGIPKRFILAPSNHYKLDHPYADFDHFVTNQKPWLPMHAENPPDDVKEIKDAKTTKILWYHMLRKVNQEFKLGIDVDDLKVGRPTLGLFPTNEMVMDLKNAKEKKT